MLTFDGVCQVAEQEDRHVRRHAAIPLSNEVQHILFSAKRIVGIWLAEESSPSCQVEVGVRGGGWDGREWV